MILLFPLHLSHHLASPFTLDSGRTFPLTSIVVGFIRRFIPTSFIIHIINLGSIMFNHSQTPFSGILSTPVNERVDDVPLSEATIDRCKGLCSGAVTPPQSLVDPNDSSPRLRLSPSVYGSPKAEDLVQGASLSKTRDTVRQLRLDLPPSFSATKSRQNKAAQTDINPFDSNSYEQESPQYSPKAPSSGGSSQSSLESVGEEVLSVIEHAVETNIAAATGPLRLGLNRFNESLRHLRFENSDLKEQNDAMSRQLDLHYRTIEQHTETFQNHTRAWDRMFESHSRNIEATNESLFVVAGIINHLSQTVVNLPVAINQVVYHAVQQHVQAALQDVMDAQQQAILAVQDHARQFNPEIPDEHHSVSESEPTASDGPKWTSEIYPQRVRDAMQPECRHKKGRLRTLAHKMLPSRW
jgi:hypothetical protein